MSGALFYVRAYSNQVTYSFSYQFTLTQLRLVLSLPLGEI